MNKYLYIIIALLFISSGCSTDDTSDENSLSSRMPFISSIISDGTSENIVRTILKVKGYRLTDNVQYTLLREDVGYNTSLEFEIIDEETIVITLPKDIKEGVYVLRLTFNEKNKDYKVIFNKGPAGNTGNHGKNGSNGKTIGLDKDSDGDGVSDLIEVVIGTDPYNKKSFPPDKNKNLIIDIVEGVKGDKGQDFEYPEEVYEAVNGTTNIFEIPGQDDDGELFDFDKIYNETECKSKAEEAYALLDSSEIEDSYKNFKMAFDGGCITNDVIWGTGFTNLLMLFEAPEMLFFLDIIGEPEFHIKDKLFGAKGILKEIEEINQGTFTIVEAPFSEFELEYIKSFPADQSVENILDREKNYNDLVLNFKTVNDQKLELYFPEVEKITEGTDINSQSFYSLYSENNRNYSNLFSGQFFSPGEDKSPFYLEWEEEVSITNFSFHDLNSDEKSDLVLTGKKNYFGNEISYLEIYTGDGNYNFDEYGFYITSTNLDQDSLKIDDINGDNLPDILYTVTFEGKRELFAHLGGNLGLFPSTETVDPVQNDFLTLFSNYSALSEEAGERENITPVLFQNLGDYDYNIADINGDGLKDLLFFWFSEFYIYINRSDGTDIAFFGVEPQLDMGLDLSSFYDFKFDDLDDDGLTDIVSKSGESELSFYFARKIDEPSINDQYVFNDGTDFFAFDKIVKTLDKPFKNYLLADFNGNGSDDIFIGSLNPSLDFLSDREFLFDVTRNGTELVYTEPAFDALPYLLPDIDEKGLICADYIDSDEREDVAFVSLNQVFFRKSFTEEIKNRVVLDNKVDLSSRAEINLDLDLRLYDKFGNVTPIKGEFTDTVTQEKPNFADLPFFIKRESFLNYLQSAAQKEIEVRQVKELLSNFKGNISRISYVLGTFIDEPLFNSRILHDNYSSKEDFLFNNADVAFLRGLLKISEFLIEMNEGYDTDFDLSIFKNIPKGDDRMALYKRFAASFNGSFLQLKNPVLIKESGKKLMDGLFYFYTAFKQLKENSLLSPGILMLENNYTKGIDDVTNNQLVEILSDLIDSFNGEKVIRHLAPETTLNLKKFFDSPPDAKGVDYDPLVVTEEGRLQFSEMFFTTLFKNVIKFSFRIKPEEAFKSGIEESCRKLWKIQKDKVNVY